MKVLFDQGFARVWAESQSPIVFSVVTKIPESTEEYALLCQHQIDLIRKTREQFRTVYSIADFSACNPMSLQLAIDYVEHHVVRQFQAGLAYKAFVKPKNLVNLSILNSAMKLTELSGIGFYNSFEAAFESVSRKIKNREIGGRDNFCYFG